MSPGPEPEELGTGRAGTQITSADPPTSSRASTSAPPPFLLEDPRPWHRTDTREHTIDGGPHDRGFGGPEFVLAQVLAQRAGLSILNAQLYREAQEANRTESDFLAVISHEHRTRSTIMGYTDLLEAEITGPVNPRQKKQLSRISTASAHLLLIADEILGGSPAVQSEIGRGTNLTLWLPSGDHGSGAG